jgi:hypothetical protein
MAMTTASTTGRLHQYGPTMTQTQMLGWADGQTVMDTTGIRRDRMSRQP